MYPVNSESDGQALTVSWNESHGTFQMMIENDERDDRDDRDDRDEKDERVK